MSRVKKIVSLLVFLPLAIVLVVLCVANRQPVTLALNPFRPDDTVLALSGPFFVFLFLALIVGMFVGSVATWLNQGHYRKQARIEAKAAIERERQLGTRPSTTSPGSMLVPTAKG
ncbi:DUF1049 domain-containing protein [Rhizobium sp. SSA_523]|uniref:DUF1049 domain-containing protein n=1 Tax=Rhizobium sp. SSA_523 TaxID=2952477 RepID=UPI00209155D3|nr:DUF1049 domain-containing protein [Rhizobium sp. SSA_523]MCO5732652.1 DUF1049 domain-containing protein [Rhizobium sp. SSA_523]WKC23718.1 DUF1049 domain-containing protein [Rhizobium sp. SSA_523]